LITERLELGALAKIAAKALTFLLRHISAESAAQISRLKKL